MKDSTGDMVNVVNRSDNVDTLETNQWRQDLNSDGTDEIVLWDEKQIRVKYSNPQASQNSTVFSRLYRTPVFDSPDEIVDEIER